MRSKGLRIPASVAWKGLAWLAVPFFLWLTLRSAPLAAAWQVISRISLLPLSSLLAINLAILGLFAMRWWSMLRGLGQRVSLPSLFVYRLAGFGVSYFTPGPQFGGEPLQIWLLRHRQSVKGSAALSSVFFDKLVEVLVNFSFLSIGLCLVALNGLLSGGKNGGWIAFSLIIPILLAYLIGLRRNSKPLQAILTALGRRWKHTFLQKATVEVGEVEEKISSMLIHQPYILARAILISALAWGLTVLEFWGMFSVLGVSLQPYQVVVAITAVRVAFLLPVPGGLGSVEAALVMVGHSLGLPAEAGLAAAIFIRARDILVGLVGLAFATWAIKTSSSSRS